MKIVYMSVKEGEGGLEQEQEGCQCAAMHYAHYGFLLSCDGLIRRILRLTKEHWFLNNTITCKIQYFLLETYSAISTEGLP